MGKKNIKDKTKPPNAPSSKKLQTFQKDPVVVLWVQFVISRQTLAAFLIFACRAALLFNFAHRFAQSPAFCPEDSLWPG